MQLLDTVERFVKERLQPAEVQVEADDAIPADVISDMRDLGLFGLSIPTAHDGLGLTMEEEAEVAIFLGQTSPAFRLLIGTNNGIVSQGIILDGTALQKTHWLPKMAAGEAIGSFALTEPDTGSDAASIRLTAELNGGDYILNGTKRYITNAPIADVFTVLARTERDIKGAKGISAFLVPADLPGISVGKPDKKLGQHGTKTADVVFENCRVPATSIIGGEPGKGFATAMKVLNRGRLHISAICVGAATRILDDALAFAMERCQFGKPIALFQLIQAQLADSRAELMAGKAMVMEAARKRDRGEKVNLDASCFVQKWLGGSLIGHCKFMVGQDIWRNTPSSVSTLMRACSASMKEQARSSN